MPLFPISTLVMPGGYLPLRIFERRYLDMITDCFRRQCGFGICMIRDGEEVGAPAVPYNCGTEVQITDFDYGADNLLHIEVRGQCEFDLCSYEVNPDGLLVGSVYRVAPPTAQVLDSQFDTLADKLRVILDRVADYIDYPDKNYNDAHWVCNRLLELLPISADGKYELLQLSTTQARLTALASLNITLAEE